MNNNKSFWSTVPGILTGIAMIISSIGGLLVALYQVNILPWSDSQPEITVSRVTIKVNGTANGKFGYPRLGGYPLAKAIVLQPDQVVRIAAAGTISLSNEGPQVGPDGANTPFREGFGRELATPLQQHLVNLGRLPLPRPDPIPQVGALIGALIPLHVADARKFSAVDEATVEPGGRGIPAASLFFIGSGPVEQISRESSVLFLGVNDPRAENNSGYFTVDIEVVP